MAQLIVVVQVLIAERKRMAALANHIRKPMAHLAPLTPVIKTPRHQRRQVQTTIDIA